MESTRTAIDMLLDYKFRWITWKDKEDFPSDGETSCLVVFTEGDYKDVEKIDPLTQKTKMVSTYVRSKVVAEKTYSFDGIVSKADICNFLNKELKEMATKETEKSVQPIPVQSSVVESILTAKSVK